MRRRGHPGATSTRPRSRPKYVCVRHTAKHLLRLMVVNLVRVSLLTQSRVYSAAAVLPTTREEVIRCSGSVCVHMRCVHEFVCLYVYKITRKSCGRILTKIFWTRASRDKEDAELFWERTEWYSGSRIRTDPGEIEMTRTCTID